MTGGTHDSKRNPLVAVLGATVLLALAVGMLVSGAASGGAPIGASGGYGGGGGGGGGGYGPVTPTCVVNGYSVPCPPEVEGVSTEPRVPRAGKGFAVNFRTSSGGTYTITAQRRGTSRKRTLAQGAAGAGKVTVKNLGKRLKAGRYFLRVTIKSGTASKTVRRTIRIQKRR
jgi:hypothetical protein